MVGNKNKTTLIVFLDDDNRKREDWIDLIDKNLSYVEFKFQGKIITIPWIRILKLKESKDE